MTIKKKSHSGATKRFKKNKNNMIKASHQGRRHILTKKSRGRKRALRKAFYLSGGDHARVLRALSC